MSESNEMFTLRQKAQDALFADTIKLCDDWNRQLKEALEYACRNMVTPPIKGEITKGKVRWRGLRLAYYPADLKMEKDGDKMNFSYEQRVELWQRDKKIF